MDLINRADVIDAIVAWTVEDRPDIEMPTDLVDIVNALPSADASLMQDKCKFDASSDFISRADALRTYQDDVCDWLCCFECKAREEDGTCKLEKWIKNLPSAEPDIVYCGECKHMMPNGICREFADQSIYPNASDYCSAGERKEE